MKERDFYGLDIISEISNKSNGRINLKKPSVYSNLTRMEKQGYISSYLKSSDFGPNRKYYSLTEKGRGFYQELKTYFDNNNIDVFKDFQDQDNKEAIETIAEEKIDTIDEKVEENDFFDFSSLNEENLSPTPQIENESTFEEAAENNYKINNQIDDQKSESEVKAEETTNPTLDNDDAVFLTQKNVDDYNKRLYDISKDINKIKRKRSFADDQIAMAATDPLYVSNERVKSNIEDFKNSILENRDRYQENRTSSFDYFKQKNIIETNKPKESTSFVSSVAKAEEVNDDGRFITNRIDESKVERARKIEPPKLKIISENTKDVRLPAPKRDKSIDPSHKEILNKLYARTKDINVSEVREDAIYDYNDLKDYYKSQDISFNIYEKDMDKVKHNTNKLYFINSVLVFLIACVISTALFFLFDKIGLTYYNTNFLFILLPALYVFDVIYKMYNYKNYAGWIPSKIRPQWQIWLFYFTLSTLIVGLNFAFGMAEKPFDLYATTLVLPLSIVFVLVPLRYYLKRLLLVKYWR